MLLLYLLLLGLLAMLTAYTRNVQSTLITRGQQIAAPGALPTPRRQALRTMVLVLAWPAAMGFGMLFIAWWKAAALMVAAFLLLVPAIGSFLPRPMSVYYLDQIRSDLEQRVARGGPDAAQLRRILAQSDALSRRGPHQRPT